ncbi:ABC transporter ATP-binding protein [Enemella sp. A6]|uniref:ABC transporter ATP-binding protein n=1 Tax=Enemella sp. A6 TaxID=3440152 RepID=UPI003EBF315D
MTALEVRDLCVAFGNRPPAVIEVNLEIAEGERLGLIGESGSGKSVTALAVMGLLPEYARVTGEVLLAGRSLLGRSDREMSKLRGDAMGMVFQEPMTALDPTMKVGRQMAEVIELHRPKVGRTQRRGEVIDMLERVGIDEPERIVRSYPHQLSGGQRQRVVLAMALINSPDLLICDEPTTALDVTVQARVLRVLDEVLAADGAACLFISHDLAVVAQVCSKVAVMLDGRIVEQGSVAQVFDDPQHSYTKGLVATSRLDRVAPGSRLPVVGDFWNREQT